MKYLAIGHVCLDLKKDGSLVPGGSVAYASRVALSMGCETTVLSAFHPDFPFVDAFSGVTLLHQDSQTTTEFKNVYHDDDRVQFLLSRADRIHLPKPGVLDDFYDIVHICPVIGELSFDIFDALPKHRFLLVTPQGWMRSVDQDGRVSFQSLDWKRLSIADLVVVSENDFKDIDKEIESMKAALSRFIVSYGKNGARYYQDAKELYFPTDPVEEIDATGAGDCFSAAFAINYCKTGCVEKSMGVAQDVAALSVQYDGLSFEMAVQQFLKSQ